MSAFPNELIFKNIFSSLLFGAIIFEAIIAITFFIFWAIGLYTMAKRRGIQYPWLAFIPIGCTYMFGALADDIAKDRGGKGHGFRWILFSLSIALFIITVIFYFCGLMWLFNMPMDYYAVVDRLISLMLVFSLLLLIVAVCLAVARAFAYYLIYKDYSPRGWVALLVLSIIIAPVASVAFFVIRNNVPASAGAASGSGPDPDENQPVLPGDN